MQEMLKAAEKNNYPKIKWLLDQGITTEYTDSLGMTPLLRTTALGHSKACEGLIEGGANVDATSYSGFTALHFAARRGDSKTVQMLLKANADVTKV